MRCGAKQSAEVKPDHVLAPRGNRPGGALSQDHKLARELAQEIVESAHLRWGLVRAQLDQESPEAV